MNRLPHPGDLFDLLEMKSDIELHPPFWKLQQILTYLDHEI